MEVKRQEEERRKEMAEGEGNKRAKDGGDIEMEGGGDGGRGAGGKEREASFDEPRVPGLPRDLTLTESQK